MAIHRLYHAGGHTSNPDIAMYPAAEVTADTPIARVAGHRGVTLNANSRYLDVRRPQNFGPSFDWRNQDAVNYYFENLDVPVAIGDTIELIVVPPRVQFTDLHWKIINPIVGFSVDVETKFTPAVLLAGIGAVAGSGFVPIGPLAQWRDATNEILQLRVIALPVTGIKDVALAISAIQVDGFTGK